MTRLKIFVQYVIHKYVYKLINLIKNIFHHLFHCKALIGHKNRFIILLQIYSHCNYQGNIEKLFNIINLRVFVLSLK